MTVKRPARIPSTISTGRFTVITATTIRLPASFPPIPFTRPRLTFRIMAGGTGRETERPGPASPLSRLPVATYTFTRGRSSTTTAPCEGKCVSKRPSNSLKPRPLLRTLRSLSGHPALNRPLPQQQQPTALTNRLPRQRRQAPLLKQHLQRRLIPNAQPLTCHPQPDSKSRHPKLLVSGGVQMALPRHRHQLPVHLWQVQQHQPCLLLLQLHTQHRHSQAPDMPLQLRAALHVTNSIDQPAGGLAAAATVDQRQQLRQLLLARLFTSQHTSSCQRHPPLMAFHLQRCQAPPLLLGEARGTASIRHNRHPDAPVSWVCLPAAGV